MNIKNFILFLIVVFVISFLVSCVKTGMPTGPMSSPTITPSKAPPVIATATPIVTPKPITTPPPKPTESPTTTPSPSPTPECDDDIDCDWSGGRRKCCEGVCKNIQEDEENCWSCGNVCEEGKLCQFGRCEDPCELDDSYSPPPVIIPTPSTCAAGLTCCPDGECADLERDETHCGSCDNQCPAGQECWDRECIETDCYPPCSILGPSICCDHRCVDSLRNGNCGACGVTCEEGEVCYNLEPGGEYQCVSERGCCMFDGTYTPGVGISYGRCEDREHPSECILEEGYENHLYGKSCSEIPVCLKKSPSPTPTSSPTSTPTSSSSATLS